MAVILLLPLIHLAEFAAIAWPYLSAYTTTTKEHP
jgi:hypothetical protein